MHGTFTHTNTLKTQLEHECEASLLALIHSKMQMGGFEIQP